MTKTIITTLLIFLAIPAFSHQSDSLRIENLQTKVENRLSFANARTQIYGNLINLFRYQNILKH